MLVVSSVNKPRLRNRCRRDRMRRWLSAGCLSGPRRRSVRTHDRPDPTGTSGGSVVEPRGSNSTADPQSSVSTGSQRMEMAVDLQVSQQKNIILNHEFSEGLNYWHPNCCHAYVASEVSGLLDGVRANSGGNYAVVTKRTESWQGLEQDITEKITIGVRYNVLAYVRAFGDLQEPCGVQATLKLENQDSFINYLFVERVLVAKDHWGKLEGSFSLTSMPKRAVFFLEGPPSGVDLLIDSVTVSYEKTEMVIGPQISHTNNIISNHDFSGGLHSWCPNCCHAYVASEWSGFLNGVRANSGGNYAVVTKRTECWQGLEQDITGKVSSGNTYFVSAYVQVYGDLQGSTAVQATLKLEYSDSSTSYLFIERILASKERWEKLEGSFSLTTMPRRIVFLLEGPPPGLDLLIDSVTISSSGLKQFEEKSTRFVTNGAETIIRNSHFDAGIHNWSGRGCKIHRHEFGGYGKICPFSGKFFVSATERSQSWNGIQQEITGQVQRKLAYEVTSVVQISGGASSADVRATLWVQAPNGREEYIGIAKMQASDKEWVQLRGKFLLNGVASKVVIFLEGPPPGTDLLVDSLVVKRAAEVPSSPPPHFENVLYGVNIIKNSTLNDGLNGWSPLGSCTLRVYTDPDHLFRLVAGNSPAHDQPLSNHYILTTNRTETWMGPSQTITGKLKLHLTYRVAAWVRVGSGATGPQNVNVALNIDNQWINGGHIEANTDRWYEVKGSFRIEKQPSKVVVYVQGPSPGVDLMLGGLQIFPVDRKARFKNLKEITEKVRKRDVVLKLPGLNSASLHGASIKIRQTQNSFPFGSCINKTNIENEEFVDFFVKNFNWAVFGNELKWYHTEPQQGKLNYKDADEMLDFCQRHGKETRGHCIFWEVEDAVQPWIRSLNSHELMMAIQNRLKSLLSRYKGKFRHYDVNNEMLHGSFYQDKLGEDIRAYMFRESHQLDPSAILFVNDYNVEDGCDSKSTPEMYIHQILDLQERGAPVGGIGIQAHISHPVGEIICDALDKLAILDLPVWFTELDVSAVNEHVRADDLEVVLREAYAHPAVGGVMLWGFWELFMFRDNSHLVDAEGKINEAGKRYLALKQEWLSHADGHIDAHGEFKFRGYHGTYTLEITTPSGKKISQSFVVDSGDSPLVLIVKL